MKRWDGKLDLARTWLATAVLLLAGSLTVPGADARIWRAALAEQTDPAKLATLGPRGANPRVNRILYYLHAADAAGTPPERALREALQANGATASLAALTEERMLENYQRAQQWGLLVSTNLDRLRRGQAGVITRGRHSGSSTDVDHIIPISLAPEAGNVLGNLRLLPASVNRAKGARIGWNELRFAGRLREAGLLSEGSHWRVRFEFVRGQVWFWSALGLGTGWLWFKRRLRRRARRRVL